VDARCPRRGRKKYAANNASEYLLPSESSNRHKKAPLGQSGFLNWGVDDKRFVDRIVDDKDNGKSASEPTMSGFDRR